MSYLDNGRIRLGVDLDLGGAITYLSKSGTDRNVVNSADWGRQIQMSHYSGPVPFAPAGHEPRKEWAGLGWNPIQCGDSFGNRSKLLDTKNDGKSIYVKCVPMQWPLNNVPGECTFECWLRLDGDAVQVRSRLLNARTDHTQYDGRGQELPAVYTNGPWYRLMTYTGDKPFTNDKLEQRPAVFMWTSWQSTENWAALLDDHDFGLGIWHPGDTAFVGGFAGKPGAGGPKDGPTGYIAPVLNEVIDWNIDYDYRYTLILGSLDEIREYVYKHTPRPKPPTYAFRGDRQHWIYRGASDSGWPIRGGLDLSLAALDAQLIGPDGFWEASGATKLTLDGSFDSGITGVKVFWKRYDSPEFSEAKSARLEVEADGKRRRFVLNLGSLPEYRGCITGVRIDLRGSLGAKARISRLSFGR